MRQTAQQIIEKAFPIIDRMKTVGPVPVYRIMPIGFVACSPPAGSRLPKIDGIGEWRKTDFSPDTRRQLGRDVFVAKIDGY